MPLGVSHFQAVGLIPDTTSGGTAPPPVPLNPTSPFLSAGIGAPTFSAPKGSLYIRTDGGTGITRLYINTDGAGTWTTIAAAA